MKELMNKSKVLVDCATITADFEGCVKFSRIVTPLEAEKLRDCGFDAEMRLLFGFARPPVAISYWSREILLLTGEIGPDTRFSLMDVLDIIIEKLESQNADLILKHALEKGEKVES